MSDDQAFLNAIGKLATEARIVAGGVDLLGYRHTGSTVETMTEDIHRLRRAIDEYDRRVVERTGR